MSQSKYPLGRMLTVRELREDQALRELRLRMAEVDAAAAAVEARKEEIIAGRAALRTAQDALFAASLGRLLDRPAEAAHRREIDAWRRKVEEAFVALAAAEKALEAARLVCEQARARYQAKMKDTHKITSHKDAWTAEAAKAQEAAADAELEEVRKAPGSARDEDMGENGEDEACRR
jgi:hypothetical protein